MLTNKKGLQFDTVGILIITLIGLVVILALIAIFSNKTDSIIDIFPF